jgi:eukaryotic-like serine/threonine-protein kinase
MTSEGQGTRVGRGTCWREASASCLVGLVLLLGLLAGCATFQVSEPLGPPPAGAPALPLEQRWSVNVDAAVGAGGLLLAGDLVLVPTRGGEVLALRLADGREVGKARFAGPVVGTPALAGHTIAVATSEGRHTLSAHSLRTGRRLWRQRVGPVEASVRYLRGHDVFVTAGLDGYVRAFDRASGEPRWAVRPDTLGVFYADPAETGGALVVADGRGRVTALDPATGAERWSADLRAPVHAALGATEGVALVATTRGALIALDAASGVERWRYTSAEPVRLTASSAGEGRVLVGGTDGVLRALDAASGAEAWVFRAPSGFTTAPRAEGGLALAAALDGNLYAVDARTGELAWTAPMPGRAHAGPVAAGGWVVVASGPRHVTGWR